MQACGIQAAVSLLATLLVLLEAEAGPPAQFPLLLGKVISARSTGPGFQDIVHLAKRKTLNLDVDIGINTSNLHMH